MVTMQSVTHFSHSHGAAAACDQHQRNSKTNAKANAKANANTNTNTSTTMNTNEDSASDDACWAQLMDVIGCDDAAIQMISSMEAEQMHRSNMDNMDMNMNHLSGTGTGTGGANNIGVNVNTGSMNNMNEPQAYGWYNGNANGMSYSWNNHHHQHVVQHDETSRAPAPLLQGVIHPQALTPQTAYSHHVVVDHDQPPENTIYQVTMVPNSHHQNSHQSNLQGQGSGCGSGNAGNAPSYHVTTHQADTAAACVNHPDPFSPIRVFQAPSRSLLTPPASPPIKTLSFSALSPNTYSNGSSSQHSPSPCVSPYSSPPGSAASVVGSNISTLITNSISNTSHMLAQVAAPPLFSQQKQRQKPQQAVYRPRGSGGGGPGKCMSTLQDHHRRMTQELLVEKQQQQAQDQEQEQQRKAQEAAAVAFAQKRARAAAAQALAAQAAAQALAAQALAAQALAQAQGDTRCGSTTTDSTVVTPNTTTKTAAPQPPVSMSSMLFPFEKAAAPIHVVNSFAKKSGVGVGVVGAVGSASPAHAPHPMMDGGSHQTQTQVYTDYANVPETEQALPPEERNTGGVVAPFPLRLHDMLFQNKFPDIVSWAPHGRVFLVHKPKEFQSIVLSKYFNQTKFRSFQRQLNLYGFRRVTNHRGVDRGGYYHELFLKGRRKLCTRMKRKAIKGRFYRPIYEPELEPNFYAMTALTDENGNGNDNDNKSMRIKMEMEIKSKMNTKMPSLATTTRSVGVPAGSLSTAAISNNNNNNGSQDRQTVRVVLARESNIIPITPQYICIGRAA
jgi:hypothetical protein